MFHFTMFGGSDVQLSAMPRVIITIFGGTDLHRQTLAKRIMFEKRRLEDSKSGGVGTFKTQSLTQPSRKQMTFAFTVFGGVDIKTPSITEEFMDMRELVSSGIVGEHEWDDLVSRLYHNSDADSISSFTLFGGIGESQLSEDDELKKLRSARELGLLSGDEEMALRSVVGRDPSQVRALLRQTAFTQTA